MLIHKKISEYVVFKSDFGSAIKNLKWLHFL